MTVALTANEKAFVLRAAHFMAQGMDAESAMRAVLRRDDELTCAALADNGTGRAIRGGLAAQTYHAIRGQNAMIRAVDDAANDSATGRTHWR